MNTTRRSEAGTQMVEMALISPLLVLLALGVADFARVAYAAITLSNAARAGGQYGVQSNAKAMDSAGIQQAARNDAGDVPGIGVTSAMSCACPSAGAISCTATCPANAAPEVYVTVTTTMTFRTIARYPFIPNVVPMTRQAVMRVQ
jgi:Flp pilus assembly protein TadG